SCPYCGLVLDRDHNAAMNILRLGLQSLQNSGRCLSLQ
ncbi:transposase, partial [Methanosarcina sp. KYL-1]